MKLFLLLLLIYVLGAVVTHLRLVLDAARDGRGALETFDHIAILIWPLFWVSVLGLHVYWKIQELRK